VGSGNRERHGNRPQGNQRRKDEVAPTCYFGCRGCEPQGSDQLVNQWRDVHLAQEVKERKKKREPERVPFFLPKVAGVLVALKRFERQRCWTNLWSLFITQLLIPCNNLILLTICNRAGVRACLQRA